MHSDTHDVFVLQTAGAKQWEVHTPGRGRGAGLLEPGHVMYLPTGTPHAARTQDTISLHITIGINQLTWRGLVTARDQRAGRRRCPDEHLPAGYLDDPQALAHQLGRHLARRGRPSCAASTRPSRWRTRYAASSPSGRRGCPAG